MQQIATITGKMQLTVPMRLAKKFGLKRGQKIVFAEKDGQLVLTPATELVEQLAGSLKTYRKRSSKSLDKIIEEAKEIYFKNHKV
ncbi:AbrB/MazE/SpoVT family DNA-binding domain-containing protein [Candidatus Daviesbacteria bacterium]|nr:AbrB/MazE/SpoVT family DNA-binding domain-containing protein [Candidatus Daviesbacteria bacterium]